MLPDSSRRLGNKYHTCVISFSCSHKNMYKPNTLYRPWLRDLAYMSAGLFMATLLGVTTARTHSGPLALVSMLCVAAAWHYYRSYSARVYGKRVEMQGQRALVKAFRHTSTRVDMNMRCATGGDIDAVLTFPYTRVAVEIKSWRGLRRSSAGLVKLSGRTLRKDPVAQARRQAASIGGRALVWMPRATRRKVFIYQGVLVVMGDARYLRKILNKLLGG